jgi:hypothetical protein
MQRWGETHLSPNYVQKVPSLGADVIALFTRTCHSILSWATWIQPTFSQPISRFVLWVLSFYLLLGLTNGYLPLQFSDWKLTHIYHDPKHATCIGPRTLWFHQTDNILWSSKLFNSPPMVSQPYRGGGVWVLLRPWELCRRSTGRVTHVGQVKG